MNTQQHKQDLVKMEPKGKTFVFASRYLPTYYGGLGQYQRSLAAYLSNSQKAKGLFLAAGLHPGHQVETPQIANWEFFHFDPEGSWERKRNLLGRLAPRPQLHTLAEKIIVNHWLGKIKKQLPEELDAIHYIGTGWDFFGFAMLEAARQRNVNFTIWPAVHPRNWGDDIIDLRFYKKADRVFAQSDNEKFWLIENGLPAEKVVRSGLPPMCLSTGNGSAFRSRYALSDRPLVLFLGRKDEGKGYFALLEAWQQVREQFPQACLLAAGPQASSATSPIGIEVEGVLNLGIVSEEEKADALSACNVFCLPSAHESFGIVYLEAWFYSKPVICGTAPACRELIENGVDGLWSSQDPTTLRDDISRLLSDPALAVEMGRHGKAKQVQQYTWDIIGQLHYQEFCRSPEQGQL